MQITPMMIDAAVNRACELGVLPRRSIDDDVATNIEIMVEILQAAMAVESVDLQRSQAGQSQSLRG